ncbi:MAG: 23S rRNA (adenine(2503)-C(2))-methyltransferase RlmN [Candidatus Limiplasma sp.]|nr:23S rRNA (adenine(2503)-C(2))-methyltransferase RlmN [Candidatus Limiplasma sp.]MEA5144787.1 23S rRNA (adenine(2503)-C(2))-methyltransferase RlmN [Candidatus Limiplasma sp.]
MLDKPALLDMTVEELGAYLKEKGQPAFRAKQIFTWLHKGVSFADMSNLPKTLRDALAQEAYDIPMRLNQSFPSKKDNTVKFLNACMDGNIIESVLMSYHYGYSLCISTQVGCKMGCAFCASTLGGCVRNLSAGEMLAQVLLANRYLGVSGHVNHIVLMGSGEPMDNYEQVVKFLRLVNHADGLNISLRSVSVSTCGIVPRIRDLAREGLPITLSISLHAPNDALRRQIMPIAHSYPLAQLMAAVRDYVKDTGRRVVFEYALIGGFNDAPQHARELAKLVAGLQCHVNLIPLNPVEERSLSPASPQSVQAFLSLLESLHISATVRREMGTDIAGACGQLRNRHLKNPVETDIMDG